VCKRCTHNFILFSLCDVHTTAITGTAATERCCNNVSTTAVAVMTSVPLSQLNALRASGACCVLTRTSVHVKYIVTSHIAICTMHATALHYRPSEGIVPYSLMTEEQKDRLAAWRRSSIDRKQVERLVQSTVTAAGHSAHIDSHKRCAYCKCLHIIAIFSHMR
jgi:hTAFII28-like protein conserved region